MSDHTLRELERAARHDEQAAERLRAERVRAGADRVWLPVLVADLDRWGELEREWIVEPLVGPTYGPGPWVLAFREFLSTCILPPELLQDQAPD